MKVPLPSENVMVRDCRCGHDGSALITDVASVLACGNNEHNKLGLNERQGFLMAMKNIFNKVLLQRYKWLEAYLISIFWNNEQMLCVFRTFCFSRLH